MSEESGPIITTVINKEGVPHQSSELAPEAVIAVSNNAKKFHVRVNVDGLLYDPKDHNTCLMSKGKSELSENKYMLKPCTEACFRYYTMYLRTKNHTHMVIAQREYSNG